MSLQEKTANKPEADFKLAVAASCKHLHLVHLLPNNKVHYQTELYKTVKL